MSKDIPREFLLSPKKEKTVESDFDCIEIQASRDHSNNNPDSRLLHLSGIHVIEYSAFQNIIRERNLLSSRGRSRAEMLGRCKDILEKFVRHEMSLSPPKIGTVAAYVNALERSHHLLIEMETIQNLIELESR